MNNLLNKNDADLLGLLSENPTYKSIELLTCPKIAVKLSCNFGGRRIYIPHNPTESSNLSQSVGLKNAQKISKIYGGMYWSTPLTQGKKEMILQMSTEGLSASKIAEALSCTERYIYKIRSEYRKF